MRALLLVLMLAQAPRGLVDYQRASAMADPGARARALERFLSEYGNGALANRAREDVLRALRESGVGDEALSEFAQRAINAATPGQQADLRQRLADRLLEWNRAMKAAREISAHGDSVRLRATHGRILMALGEREAGRQILKQVLTSNPEFAHVAEALAQSEADPRERREYEVLARLTDPKGFEAATVDGVYRRWFPLKPVGPRQHGPALVEFFTSASCIPCQGAELAFDALADSGVVAIAHHVNIPGEDPLTHAAADEHRRRRRAPGVPMFFVNGVEMSEGGTRAAAPRILQALEEQLRAKPVDSKAMVQLTVTRQGGRLEVQASYRADEKALVSLALVEREVRHSGPNAVRFHRNVVRAFVTGAPPRHVFAAEPGHEWLVAAYLESSEGRRILAAAISGTPP